MQNSGIRNEERYHSLAHKGYRTDKTEKSSTDANGRTKPYNEWTKEELYQQARKVGIPGRSYMNKKNLVDSLRNNQN